MSQAAQDILRLVKLGIITTEEIKDIAVKEEVQAKLNKSE